MNFSWQGYIFFYTGKHKNFISIEISEISTYFSLFRLRDKRQGLFVVHSDMLVIGTNHTIAS